MPRFARKMPLRFRLARHSFPETTFPGTRPLVWQSDQSPPNRLECGLRAIIYGNLVQDVSDVP
jgi:hypothetical protein